MLISLRRIFTTLLVVSLAGVSAKLEKCITDCWNKEVAKTGCLSMYAFFPLDTSLIHCRWTSFSDTLFFSSDDLSCLCSINTFQEDANNCTKNKCSWGEAEEAKALLMKSCLGPYARARMHFQVFSRILISHIFRKHELWRRQ